MNILVIGANGRSGREVVKLAIDKDHSVSVLIRNDRGFYNHNVNIKQFIGDATNQKDCLPALENQNAVISVIGHNSKTAKDVQTTAIKSVIKALKQLNQTTKIVSLTGTGVRQPGDHITFIDRLMNLAIQMIDPNRVKDGINHAKTLKSYKTWVIVRVLKLTNRQLRGNINLTMSGPAKTFVTHTQIAEALLSVTSSKTWDNKMPIISKQ